MSKEKTPLRIGIDIGGTFTDFTVLNLGNMEMQAFKVPSTPANLLIGIEEGLQEIMRALNLNGEEIKLLAHGTTAAINALIERKGAKTGLITTEGFRDILEIGELYRPREFLYDPFREREAPFIQRRHRIEAKERISYDGRILKPLDEKDLLKKIAWLYKEGITSIAVCTLFSYMNPVHENRIGELIDEHYPNISITLSNRVSPEMGEYKRTCTTVAESYIKPIIGRYVPEFEISMRKANIKCPLCLMRGDGGLADLETAMENPSRLLLSGPVGGVVAASYLGELIGRRNLLTLDMGGTSCDASIVIDKEAQEVSERETAGMPIMGPFIHIATIGAGGGSIARVNEVGELLVGPESAGADPGPACYERGGKEPTVTDANLVLGLLNPDSFAKIHLSIREAWNAIDSKIAKPLNIEVKKAALAIRDIIDSKLAGAIRLVSVERGFDPKDFTLVVFGAAGPLEAGSIADDLGIREVIIPRFPGVFCSLGMLLTDLKFNYLQTVFLNLKDEPCEDIEAAFEALEQKAKVDLMRGQDMEDQVFIRSLDMRYMKQSYVLNIPLGNSRFNTEMMRTVGKTFLGKHEELYGFIDEMEKIKIVNVRLTVFGKLQRPNMNRNMDKVQTVSKNEEARKGRREILTLGEIAEVYNRDKLNPGTRLDGPTILEATDTTVFIPSNYHGQVDEYGNLILRKA